jgi:hypothetical protein
MYSGFAADFLELLETEEEEEEDDDDETEAADERDGVDEAYFSEAKELAEGLFIF